MWAMLTWWIGVVEAAPHAAVELSVAQVRFDTADATIPVYRGPVTDFLPAILARVRGPAQIASGPVLAVVDLTGVRSRMREATVRALGIESPPGASLVLPEVSLKGLTLLGLHVDVVDQGADFVLGVRGLGVAASLGPVDGDLDVVPAPRGELLLRALGSRRGEGSMRGLDGRLQWPGGVLEGTMVLDTSRWPATAAAPRLPPRLSPAALTVAGVALPSGAVDVVGGAEHGILATIGYDRLYGMAIAMDPSQGRVGIAPGPGAGWRDPAEVAAASARERFASHGLSDVPRVDAAASEGLSPPTGDIGNAVLRARWADAADTLWRAGQPTEALRYQVGAVAYAGDRCLAHLTFAERVLAGAGGQLEEPTVARGVLASLRRAAGLWTAWTSLDPVEQSEIAAGRPVSGTLLRLAQPAACDRAPGLMLAVFTVVGDLAARDRFEADHVGTYPSVAYARALTLLASDPIQAERHAERGRAAAGIDPLDSVVLLVAAKARRGKASEVLGLVRELTTRPTDHPLSAALALAAAIYPLGEPEAVTAAILSSEPRDVALQLAHALVTGAQPPAFDLDRLRERPHDPGTWSLQAAHAALSGDVLLADAVLLGHPALQSADWWAARAVIAWTQGDLVARDRALSELRVRFPLLPLGYLGVEGVDRG